jgi:hypothetical protein
MVCWSSWWSCSLQLFLASIIAVNTNAEGSSDAWLSLFDMDASLLLTRALTIITRAPHNRKIFSYFGGLQPLMGVMKGQRRLCIFINAI